MSNSFGQKDRSSDHFEIAAFIVFVYKSSRPVLARSKQMSTQEKLQKTTQVNLKLRCL